MSGNKESFVLADRIGGVTGWVAKSDDVLTIVVANYIVVRAKIDSTARQILYYVFAASGSYNISRSTPHKSYTMSLDKFPFL